MTVCYQYPDLAVKFILDLLDKKIVLAVPLGIGKPMGFINALYRAAKQDPTIELTILTGLTLSRKKFHHELEQRFLGPIQERLLTTYEDPLYEQDRLKQQVPKNIQILEFFLAPGQHLKNSYVQRNYISTRYSNVMQDIVHYKVNVVAQQVVRCKQNPNKLSLSCNSDLFIDVLSLFSEQKKHNKKFAIIGEMNSELPYMHGDAEIGQENFSCLIDDNKPRALFALPREEVAPQEHLIGLYTSTLIKDDGCLQIGIGKLGTAVANALILRQRDNKLYQELLAALHVKEKFFLDNSNTLECSTFEKGLYASTELMSDEYLKLHQAEILKKRVYDHTGLQYLLNEGAINENVDGPLLERLLEEKLIQPKLSAADVNFCKTFGIFKQEVNFDGTYLISADEKIPANLTSTQSKEKIIQTCLGTHLKHGYLLHAAFFLGSTEFYQSLRDLPLEVAKQFNMTSVLRTNTLDFRTDLMKLQRKNARFVNTAMMVTLNGAAVSDRLMNGTQVSGVGGQFDFVHMSQALPDSKSIINCRSTRGKGKRKQSNIVWEYPNLTIPRFLRDIIITEYGIADCRSQTDEKIIQRLLNITDQNFQSELLNIAKRYRKIDQDYTIPTVYRENNVKHFKSVIKELKLEGFIKPYPNGCDLTAEELMLKKALGLIKNCTSLQRLSWVWKGFWLLRRENKGKIFQPFLSRLNLLKPENFQIWCYQKLLVASLSKILPDPWDEAEIALTNDSNCNKIT